MRTIKFRFWEEKSKTMIDWLCVRQTALNRGDMHMMYDMMGTNPEIVKMQFAGHQINGTDLYEGDIVRLEENADGVDPDDKMTYYVVVWLQEWCMFALLRTKDEYSDYLASGAAALDADMFWTFPLDPSDTETSKHYLCGNIYEHSELLQPIK